jgi:hypothetical protein
MDLRVLKIGVGKWSLIILLRMAFAFLKFNFSHNGLGLEDSADFDQ